MRFIRANLLRLLFALVATLGLCAIVFSIATGQLPLALLALCVTAFAPVLFIIERRMRINNQRLESKLQELAISSLENRDVIFATSDILANKIAALQTIVLLDKVYGQRQSTE